VTNFQTPDPTYLGQVPMFSGCTREQLIEIGRLGDAIDAAEGSDVVREGDAGEGLYVITSGTAVVLRGGRQVALLAPGDYFGELSLFDAVPRNATVQAREKLSCIMLTREAFTKVLDVPTIRDALLHGMAARIRQYDQRAYWSR
jgi:CRP-like cAMP-binding protein